MTTRHDPLTAAARWVGDLGHPFYAEERQRDVWNEASAVGFQLLLWSTLLATTVTVWTVGAPALPYAVGALLLVGLVSWFTLSYAARLGVDITRDGASRRLLALGLLMFALVGGMVHAARDDSTVGAVSWSSLAGVITGAAVGGLCAALGLRHMRKRLSRG